MGAAGKRAATLNCLLRVLSAAPASGSDRKHHFNEDTAKMTVSPASPRRPGPRDARGTQAVPARYPVLRFGRDHPGAEAPLLPARARMPQ